MNVTIDPTGRVFLTQPELNEEAILDSLKERIEFFSNSEYTLLEHYRDNTSAKRVKGYVTAKGEMREYGIDHSRLPLALITHGPVDMYLYPHDTTGFVIHTNKGRASSIWVGKYT